MVRRGGRLLPLAAAGRAGLHRRRRRRGGRHVDLLGDDLLLGGGGEPLLGRGLAAAVENINHCSTIVTCGTWATTANRGI